MRPKKIILCVDSDEKARSVLAFMLSTNGYKVYQAAGLEEAVAIFSSFPVDLVLCAYVLTPPTSGPKVVRRLKQIAAHIPMVLLGPAKELNNPHGADALLVHSRVSSLELLERIHVLSARKRGPRKGSHRIPPATAVPVTPEVVAV